MLRDREMQDAAKFKVRYSECSAEDDQCEIEESAGEENEDKELPVSLQKTDFQSSVSQQSEQN